MKTWLFSTRVRGGRGEPGVRYAAVDGVSIKIGRGETVALVGESGSGKTTLAQSILRLIEPTSGTIRLEGTDITALSGEPLRALRRRMQMVYQDPYVSLDPRFTVQETVEEPLRIHRSGDAASRRDTVAEALASVDLSPPRVFAHRYPHELSGGQRQRVAIAASLVLDPALLVADEPASMLDVSMRAGILEVLDRLRVEKNMGILLITHDLATAARFASSIAVMYLGRIVECGPSATVIGNPEHPYTRALISVVPQRDAWKSEARAQILVGETPSPDRIPPGCRFHPRCPLATSECQRTDPKLELVQRAQPMDHLAACIFAHTDNERRSRPGGGIDEP